MLTSIYYSVLVVVQTENNVRNQISRGKKGLWKITMRQTQQKFSSH